MPNFNFNMFQRNAKKQVNKSFKDLSFEWKHDFTLGDLIPCLSIPTLPGDEFEIESQFFFKFEPMYLPIIHRVGLDVDFFWVRNSNMWLAQINEDVGWKEFITLQTEVLHPTVNVDMRWYSATTQNDSIYGYLGVPYLFHEDGVRSTLITGLNAFPAMAYLMIYDQYYRHPQLEAPRVSQTLIAGDNTAAITTMFGFSTPTNIRLKVFPAKWGKDYFTSCLPTPQAGDPVTIPLINEVGYEPSQWRIKGGTMPAPAGDLATDSAGETVVTGLQEVYLDLDLNANAATIRDLSLAAVMQTLKEQLMRFSSRYKDWIDAVFNQDVDPLNLDIPIMIGTYRGSVNVSDQFTQANTMIGENEFNTGDYTGSASLYEQGTIRYKCHDYGLLMAIFSLTPNTGYGQGIPRYMRYSSPFDYPMDIFCGIGDQEILKEEVMYNNVIAEASKNQETFGYGVRYQEAFTIPNNYGSNLGWQQGLSWHLGKYYDPEVLIGTQYDDFIEINRNFVVCGDTLQGGTRVRDVFKVLTTPNGAVSMNPVTGYIYHKIGAVRPLPAFSTPSLGGI